MTDSVRILPGNGRRDPKALLETAKNVPLEEVLIICNDGEDIWFSCSSDDGRDMMWMLEMTKAAVLDIVRSQDDG